MLIQMCVSMPHMERDGLLYAFSYIQIVVLRRINPVMLPINCVHSRPSWPQSQRETKHLNEKPKWSSSRCSSLLWGQRWARWCCPPTTETSACWEPRNWRTTPDQVCEPAPHQVQPFSYTVFKMTDAHWWTVSAQTHLSLNTFTSITG